MTTSLACKLGLAFALCVQAGGGEDNVPAGREPAAGVERTVDAAGGTARRGTAVRWITLPDERLQVCGLPWFQQNGPLMWRLPRSGVDKLPPAVQRLMRFPTGARIRLAVNTTSLRVRLRASRISAFSNMSPTGSRGLDAYVDGTYWSTAIVADEGEQELTFFQGAAGTPKEITVYLPSFQEATVLAVGIDADARLGTPAPFAKGRPMVFYGSSIAQGACAGRPGMSYEAILARRLHVDYVNLGFSGSGKAEQQVVDRVAQIEACCFVFDLGKSYRMQPADVYAAMLRSIRAAHPDVPMVCITPIFSTREVYDEGYAELSEYVRKVVEKAARDRMKSGDGNVHLVDGLELLGPDDADGFQEGVHPNDLGFVRIADRLERVFRRVLDIPNGQGVPVAE